MPHDHDNTLELGRMVDQGRLDDVLALVSLQDIAEAWSCFHERQRSNGWAAAADPDWWAVDFWVTSSHSSGPESLIRQGLLVLVDTVPEELLAYVGAGPLMNFVGPDEDRIAWIESVAAKSSRFRAALTAVAAWNEEGWVVQRLGVSGVTVPKWQRIRLLIAILWSVHRIVAGHRRSCRRGHVADERARSAW